MPGITRNEGVPGSSPGVGLGERGQLLNGLTSCVWLARLSFEVFWPNTQGVRPWLLLPVGQPSQDVDLADARNGGALRDVQREQPKRIGFGLGLDRPPDRVSAGAARGERWTVAK